MNNIKILPELKSCLLPLSKEEKIELERSLVEEGCRDSLVLWGDILIDGHNRFEICEEHNIPYKTIQKDFKNIDEVKIWIFKNQLARRNLNNVVKIEIAEKVMEERKKLAKEKQLSTLKQNTINATMAQKDNKKEDIAVNVDTPQTVKKQEKINVNKEIGDIAGVSECTVARYNTIRKHAPEEIKEKVKSGEMSINQAYGLAKMQEDLDKYVKNNCKETTEIEEQKSIREQREKELEEIRKQNKIQQYFMKTIGDAMSLIIDNEHIEAWFSDMNMEEIQSEFTDIEKAINNLQDLKTEAKIYLNKNKLKVVK